MSLNLPIPSPHGKACIVKLYNDPNDANADAKLSVNDTVEFVGIVSLDPSLAMDDSAGATMDANDVFAQFSRQEVSAKQPPPSLVPRLHVLAYERLEHCNPLCDRAIVRTTNVQEEAMKCRQELHSLLTNLLMGKFETKTVFPNKFYNEMLINVSGDALAADYLICHLVSKIYLRRDVLTLGKFSLNLFNVPLHENFTKRLATVLQLFVSKSHYMPMTVEAFNKNAFVPKKDYHANRLVSGMLQLSKHTHLILDETAMGNGELSQEGLKNLTALGSMINWQRLEYDFNYHRLEFDSDVPCLVLSEGRSMLPNDCQVR